MSLSTPDPLSAQHDRNRKRRKTRKGTQSCWECKRRKIRCAFAASTDAICNGCRHRGTTCISQEFDDEPSSNRRIGDRLGQVEALVGKLAENAGIKTSGDGDGPAVHHFDNDTPTLSKSEPVPKPSQPLSCFSPVLDTEMAVKYDELSRTLLAVWPDQHDLDLIVCMPVGTLKLLHGVICMSQSSFLAQDAPSPADILQLPETGSHPVLIARKLLLLGSFLQGVPPSSADDLAGLTVNYHEIMSRAIETAARLVTSNDNIIDSIEGVECIMIESMYYNDAGNLRRAYLTMRRAMTIAQMLGLHRGINLASIAMLEPETWTRISARHMWFRIVQSDRYLSLMLGLPQGTLDNSFASQDMLECCTPMERMERLYTVAAGRLLQRNETDVYDQVATHDIDTLIQQAAACMPSQWWLIPALTSKGDNDAHTFDEANRIMLQFAHYHLLTRLYLPYLLRLSTNRKDEYGKITAIAASRELVTRFVAFRKFHTGASYCRGVDFLVFIASAVLSIAHIIVSSECQGGVQEGDYRYNFHFLAHQRLSDRGLIECGLESFESMLHASTDMIAPKIACALKNLLAIEADAAKGASCSVNLYSGGGEEELGCNGKLSDNGNVLRNYIPHFGTIEIKRGNVSKSMPTTTLFDFPGYSDDLLSTDRQEERSSNNTYGGTKDALQTDIWNVWPLQGVDIALFENLIPESVVSSEMEGSLS